MAVVKRLCVYCGSSARVDETYRAAATRFGALMARAGIELVYGGGRVGLMGLVANAALADGGRVTGIIPGHLHDLEVGHSGVSELIVVDNMHERKKLMFDLSDAFTVLPGGLGTLDETFEIITWRQLKLHEKPVIIVNIRGYWAPLKGLLDHAVDTGFAPPRAHGFYQFVDSVEDVLAALAAAPQATKPADSQLV